MALSIRLQRWGSKKDPKYRMVVAERLARRDGRFVEIVGTYAPRDAEPSRNLNVKLDRVDYWTSCGAQPTDTVRSLIKKARKAAPAAA